ncbi:MAG: response regulator transcription factor [Syntrophomonadaceae bacterium]|nr:response regulator transcription factor [Syntrophomonadaceae bacterium]
MHKILIVEDDQTIAAAIQRHIETWGWSARCVGDFSDVIGAFLSYDPQLVLLDIALPFYNGYHWCAEIRKRSQVPIIFISSASDNMNLIMAVNMGADDFISKPFDLSVLTAKVQAMLRRAYEFTGTISRLEHRGAILNMDDASLMVEGQRIELSKNDYRILQLLMESKGKIVSRDSIMTRLWETDSYIDDNTLTVNMARLRKKLEAAGLRDFITTKKGMGYVVE